MKHFFFVIFAVAGSAACAQKLPSYAPSNGIVAWYPLSQTTTFSDISGNNTNGTGHAVHIATVMDGSFQAGADRFNDPAGAMKLSGLVSGETTENYFESIPYPYQRFPDGFSIGGWYLGIPNYTVSQAIFSKGLDDRGSSFDVSYDGSDRLFRFTIRTDATASVATPDDMLNDTGWHFIVATFDGVTIRLYLDGEKAAERVLDDTERITFRENLGRTKPFRFGSSFDKSKANGAGALDDVFIYNRAIDRYEIADLFRAGSNVPLRLLLQFDFGYLDMGESAGRYPLLNSSAKPNAAAVLNRGIQMADLGKIRTAKNPDALKTDRMDIDWSYTIGWPTQRILIITPRRTITNLESRGGEELSIDYFPHYADAATGDLLPLYTFFTPAGYTALDKLIWPPLNAHLNDTRLSVNQFTGDFMFESGDGVRRNVASTTIPAKTVDPYLSDYGKYYFRNGPLVTQGEQRPDHLWAGVLGTNIHLTLLLSRTTSGDIEGAEVYDNYGTAIPLKGTYQSGILKLSELDGKGQAVGSFDLVMKDRKVTGSWSNKEGTKKFPFVGKIGAE